jgi:hypothetical protein
MLLCQGILPKLLLFTRILNRPAPWSNQRPWQTGSRWKTERSDQGLMGLPLGSTLQECANPLMFRGMGCPNIYMAIKCAPTDFAEEPLYLTSSSPPLSAECTIFHRILLTEGGFV